jgi:hypothetical protein
MISGVFKLQVGMHSGKMVLILLAFDLATYVCIIVGATGIAHHEMKCGPVSPTSTHMKQQKLTHLLVTCLYHLLYIKIKIGLIQDDWPRHFRYI